MKKTVFALSAIFLLAATGCKKDKDKDCEETVAAIAGNYKITAITLNGANQMSSVDDCEKNAVLSLKSDNTVTYTENGTCTDSGTGTWSVSGTTISITHDGAGMDYSGTVVNKCSNIVITETVSGGGVDFTLAATLTRQ